MIDVKKLDKFVQEMDDMKKKNKKDLSSDQDLSVAVMDLISLEQHFFFSGAKTEDTKYYDLINEVREMRKELMLKLIPHYQGEEWCISKHLLSASMRLMEVGTKQLDLSNTEDAYAFFQKSYDLYSLFWGINMKLLDMKDVKKIDEGALDVKDKNKKSIFKKLGSIVKHAVDCCIE